MPPKSKSKIKSENIRVEKPARFTDAEWGALTPLQKIRYAGNPALWKRGETGKVRGTRQKTPKHARLDRIPLDNTEHPMVRVSGAGVPAVGSGGGGDREAAAIPAFEVLESDDPREMAQVNGARLMGDAYKRAARAGMNVDPFDKHVYLALLQKMPGLKLEDPDAEETPAQAKANARRLKVLLEGPAGDAEFREVRDGEGA